MQPTYKANLILGTEKKTPNLDDIVKSTLDWQKNQPHTKTAKVNILRPTTPGTEYLGIDLQYVLGNENHKLTVGASKTPNDLPKVSIITAKEGERGIIPKDNKIIVPPTLTANFIKKFQGQFGFPLHANEITVNSSNAIQLLDMITMPQRQLPLVLLNHSKGKKPQINPKKLGQQLAGIAHVYYIPKPTKIPLIGSDIEKSLELEPGSMVIYWPDINNDENLNIEGWQEKDIKENSQEIQQELLQKIIEFSLFKQSEITYAQIEEVEEKLKVVELGLAKKDLEGQLTQAQQENKRQAEELVLIVNKRKEEDPHLEEKVLELEYSVVDLKQQLEKAKAKSQSLQYALDSKQETNSIDSTTSKEESVKIDSPLEAYTRFQEIYGTTKVILTPGATRQLKKIKYENFQDIFDMFEWLATTYLEAKNTGLTYIELNKLAIEKIGMQYSNHQNKSTMKQFKNDYFAIIDGKKVELEEHLRIGTGWGGKSLRTLFYHDAQKNQVRIGFIEKHPKNPRT